MNTEDGKCLELQRKILNIIGQKFESDAISILYKVYFWINIIIPGLITIYILYFVTENTNNIEVATEGLTPALSSILTIIKQLVFYFNKSKLNEIYVRVIAMESKVRSVDFKLINKSKKWTKIVTSIYLVATICTALYYGSIPIINRYISKNADELVKRDLPLRVMFHFDHTKSPIFEILYFIIAYCLIIIAMCAVGVDSLFSGFIFLLDAHLKIIKENIKRLIFERPSKVKRQEQSNQVLFKDICRIIQHHNCVLNLCEEVKHAYEIIIFFQFFISSLQLCLIGYQLTLSVNNLNIVTYISFLIAILVQLFIYAYGGHLITTESLTIGDALYQQNWHLVDSKIKSFIILIIMRSQKTFLMKAGFYTASIHLFARILKAAISYITLLQKIANKRRNKYAVE